MILLKNDVLTVTIAKQGAELKSIKDINLVEYMWHADAKFWNKTSPVLFPIVGSLKNNTYFYDNKPYHLPRHGFARDYEFDCKILSDTEAIFTLEANVETYKVYPFLFKLSLHYQLLNNSLSCTYIVTNLDSKTMPFCIGGHPAFSLPDGISNYALYFNNDTVLNRLKLTTEGLISNKTETIALNNQYLPLSHELFYKDALVFRDLKSTEILILNKKVNKKVTFSFEGFTHFGIWSAPNAPFICLEPWCGMADLENHNQNIDTKEGVINVDCSKTITKSYQIIID
jgi:galactose mutarotase-like enzyme